MDRIVARSRIGFWTVWEQGGERFLNIRDDDGSTVTVTVPDHLVRSLIGDHGIAHETARELARTGQRLGRPLPTPGLWTMGTEPEAFEYRSEDREVREAPRRLAA
jgi:hypothetical protein